ncbi:MAG: Beta-galactosidase [Phycisphaerae bacterium]|nr:Beta-galactosidase [Phycisphaerae bacterium]
MRYLLLVSVVALVVLPALRLLADPPAISPTGRQNLFGATWQVHVVPNDPKQADRAVADSADDWFPIEAPFVTGQVAGLGQFPAQKVHYAWAKRTFTAPPEQAYRNAVLHLHGVRWGNQVWLNGKLVGQGLGGYGAFEYDVTDSIRWGEENQLLIRMTGWAQVPMSGADDPRHVGKTPLIPHGPAMFSWGSKQTCMVGGVWIDYFDFSRPESVLVSGDPTTGAVHVRGRMRNFTRQIGRRWIEPTVLRDGQVIATGARVEVPWPNTGFARTTFDFDFEVSRHVADPAAWTTQTPNLYQLRLDLVQEGRRLARWEEDFGFRTFEARKAAHAGGAGYFLNGRRVFLRGICMWGEGSHWPARLTRDPATVRRYLIDVPKQANLNCVRNHTIPLDGEWLRQADRGGMMVLQEFPITINYRHPAYTPAEEKAYHQQCLDEFGSLLPLYWNHPSVVIWAETNESGFDADWENGPLYRLFHDADPSRPVMRTSEQSPDLFDTHNYAGFWDGSEGLFALAAVASQAKGQAAGLPVTNTEYVEGFGRGRVTKWLGEKPASMSDADWESARREEHAQVILQQTETLRRLGYDGTLPYAWGMGYIGAWADLSKPVDLLPNFYALRSSQAPVIASLDMENRHFTAGSTVTTGVTVCDDTGQAWGGRSFRVLLVQGNPGFDWAAGENLVKTVWHREMTTPSEPGRAAPDGSAVSCDRYRCTLDVACPLPKEPGRYYLLAIYQPKDAPAVMSRRVVDVVAPPPAERLKGRKVAVIGSKQLADALHALAPTCQLVPADKADVILVAPYIHADLSALGGVAELAAIGRRVVVLQQDRPIPPLGLDVPRAGGNGGASTAFRDGPGDFYAWRGMGDDSRLLRRFNGATGAVVRLPLTPAAGDQVLLRASQDGRGLDWAVMARRTTGKGEIVFCQMPLEMHLTGPDADPVAATLLVNLLASP